MKLRKLAVPALLTAAALTLSACAADADAQPTAVAGDNADISIGFAVSTLQNPFFVTMVEGIEAQGSESGVNVTVADASDDALAQANDILNFIAMGVDVVIINPVDGDAAVVSVEALNDAGIPVITLNRRINGGDITGHIGTDNILAGQTAARYFFDAIGGHGRVAIIEGIPGTSSSIDRGIGIDDVLAEFPGIEIVASQPANWNRAEGLTVAENILQANPDLDAILSMNDEMALGAIEALRAIGRVGQVPVIGIDGTDDAIAAVASGELMATFAQQAYAMGRIGILEAIVVATGGSIAAEQPVDVVVIDSSNYADFQ